MRSGARSGQANGGTALLLAAALALAGCGGTPSTGSYRATRDAAGIPPCPAATAGAVEGGLPAVQLECLGADSRVSMDRLRGPLLVLLWAQWCGPCREEMPMLGRVLPDYDGRLQVLLVLTRETRFDYAIELARDTGMRYPVVVDGDQALLAGLGQGNGIPQSVLVGADGRVVQRRAGAWTEAALRDALRVQLGMTP